MNQPAAIAILLCIVTLLQPACDRPAAGPSTRPATATVASLSPAVTDLIVAMGLADRLVGVSNFEPPRPQTDALPRVGDYRTVDWEQLSLLRPAVVITQYRPDKMPPGFMERCDERGIRVFNRKIDSLKDSFDTIAELGEALEAPEQAAAAQAAWVEQMRAVTSRTADLPKPRVLLVVGETGLSAAGPGTFLDDLLKVAGGQNVLTDGRDYITMDREKLGSLDPEVIIQFLPAASPQTIDQAKAFWKSAPQLQAVKAGRVYQVTDHDALLPGYNVCRIAAKLADLLHPRAGSVGAPRRALAGRPS